MTSPWRHHDVKMTSSLRHKKVQTEVRIPGIEIIRLLCKAHTWKSTIRVSMMILVTFRQKSLHVTKSLITYGLSFENWFFSQTQFDQKFSKFIKFWIHRGSKLEFLGKRNGRARIRTRASRWIGSGIWIHAR